MSVGAFLLRRQAEITIEYDEAEDCFSIEQEGWLGGDPSVILVSAWNMPDFLQRIESVLKAYRKAPE